MDAPHLATCILRGTCYDAHVNYQEVRHTMSTPVPQHVEPPAITRPGKKSPYIVRDIVAQVAEMVRAGWTSPIGPQDTPSKARIAANAWKRELSAFMEKPLDAFATRIWPERDRNNRETGKHVFAIVLKEGA